MNDLEQRVKTLETKVKVLEETLETLKNMSLSEQMGSFIQSRQKSLRMVELLNSVSDDDKLDFDKERASLDNVRTAKQNIDAQIAQAVMNAGTFSDDLPGDPRYFNYEVESGMEEDSFWKRKEKIAALSGFTGKGLRITAYNGFETDRVIIPNEIDGQPVISIGEKVFMNAPISEVVLPKSLKAILGEAFRGCSNIKHIDLPDTIEYLGKYCFADSGIVDLVLPASLTKVPEDCCCACKQLKKVSFGSKITTIGYAAFQGCSEIREISLPEALLNVEFKSFEGTSISTMIFPSNVKQVSKETFGDNYTRTKHDVVCVFLGKETVVDVESYKPFTFVSLIYCLPGSKIQQIARERKIPMKPLSDFRMEDYQ